MINKEKQPIIAIMALIVLFTMAWSVIIIQKYYAFNATVFDLGVSSNLMYEVFHGSSLIQQFQSKSIAMNKLIYIPMAIFYNIYPDPLGLEIFQAFWLSLGALPVYLIARKKTTYRYFPFFASLIYLLYFPLAGAYYFDFHFIAIFPTFFLFGFYFYLSGKLKISSVMMFFAVISDFLVPVIVFFFSLYILMFERKTRKSYPVILMVISSLSFLLTVSYFGIHYLIPFAGGITSGTSTAGKGVSYNILYYIFDLSFPFGFLQFLSPETMIISIPYFALIYFNHYFAYYSPTMYQYPALAAPVIVISFIYGYTRLEKILNKKYLRSIIRVVLVVSVIAFILFTPPGNYITNDNSPPLSYANSIFSNYYALQNSQVMPYDHSLLRMVDMIPQGSSVLIQNNMPQLTNGYSWYLPANLDKNIYPEYIITDPYNPWFYNVSISPGYISNMEYYTNYYLSTGRYGIYAQAENCILLKYGYHGAPVMFIPSEWKYDLGSGNSTVNISVIGPGYYDLSLSNDGIISMNLSYYDRGATLTGMGRGSYKIEICRYINNFTINVTSGESNAISITEVGA
ncbi:MAG: DUF2079 domain-containing protein [Thermoplasmata archaeon]